MLIALVILSTILGAWILFSLYMMTLMMQSHFKVNRNLDLIAQTLDLITRRIDLLAHAIDSVSNRVDLESKRLDSFKDEGDWWKQ